MCLDLEKVRLSGRYKCYTLSGMRPNLKHIFSFIVCVIGEEGAKAVAPSPFYCFCFYIYNPIKLFGSIQTICTMSPYTVEMGD